MRDKEREKESEWAHFAILYKAPLGKWARILVVCSSFHMLIYCTNFLFLFCFVAIFCLERAITCLFFLVPLPFYLSLSLPPPGPVRLHERWWRRTRLWLGVSPLYLYLFLSHVNYATFPKYKREIEKGKSKVGSLSPPQVLGLGFRCFMLSGAAGTNNRGTRNQERDPRKTEKTKQKGKKDTTRDIERPKFK